MFLDEITKRDDLMELVLHLLEVIPDDQVGLFKMITKREISAVDSAFIQKCTKWDWRERSTAKQLLEDEWFSHMEDD